MNDLYPVLSIADSRSFEASALGSEEAVAAAMEAAGKAIGAAIDKDFQEWKPWPAHPRMAILAGKGFNTGDALVAAETLFGKHPGLQVLLVLTAPEGELVAPVAGALARLRASLGSRLEALSTEDFLADTRGLDLCVDGLFGLNFQFPLREPAVALLQHVNARTDIGLRVSIDIPSGIGEACDPHAFVADFTYIPGVAKEPCFREGNARWVGRLRFLPLTVFGQQKPLPAPSLNVADPAAYRRLNRLRSAHADKRHHGHCIIIAGSALFPGAALMTTQAALRSGAGLVTTFSPATIAGYLASAAPEAMWRPIPILPDGGYDVEVVRMVSAAAAKAHAMVIGPGLILDRSTTFAICRIIREVSLPLVLDASALTQDIVSTVLARPAGSGPVLITPHTGEFARMHGLREERADIAGLIRFSGRHRAVTILKGSPTLIADGDRVVAAPVGGPVLARGGSGDILSGILVSLLSRDASDPFRTAVEAVTWHGAAGDALARHSGAVAVTTTQILDYLPTTLRALD